MHKSNWTVAVIERPSQGRAGSKRKRKTKDMIVPAETQLETKNQKPKAKMKALIAQNRGSDSPRLRSSRGSFGAGENRSEVSHVKNTSTHYIDFRNLLESNTKHPASRAKRGVTLAYTLPHGGSTCANR